MSNTQSTPKVSLAKLLRYRMEWLVVIAAGNVVPMLPHSAVVRLARYVGWLACKLDTSGRRIAVENLRVAFGDRYTIRERQQIATKSYQHFARAFIDLFWSKNLNTENFRTLITYHYEDQITSRDAIRNGAICLTPHYSNFEWLSLCYVFVGQAITIIAQDFKNPFLTRVFRKFRELSGHRLIPQQRAMIRLLKLLKSGESTALLPDLKMPPGSLAVVSKIFGLPVSTTPLHAILAKRTGTPLLPTLCLPNDDGTYEMRILKPLPIEESDTIEQIVQKCWDVFEPMISDRPEPWLWMYKHWRYRSKNHPERFPDYSNFSAAFDKMEKRDSADGNRQ